MTETLSVPRVSLVARVVETIEREMAAGRWKGGLPAERELCRLLQVSRTTVRAALLELERRGGIERGARRRPAPRKAVRIPRGRANLPATVTVLSPIGVERLGRFELIWLDALREQLAASGVSLQLQEAHKAFTGGADGVLAKLVAERAGAAWVLLRSSREMQSWFEATGVPTMIAGSRHEGIALPAVEVDVEAAVRHAANYLAGKGHRSLAFFIEPGPAAGVSRSEGAFLDAGAKAGVEVRVHHHGPTRDEFLRLFAKQLASETAPTGILIERYTHALSALTWLLGRGHRWPGPIGLLSREDTASFDHSVPGVSSYQYDPLLFARKAARVLSTILHGGSLHGKEYRVQPKLIRRETV